MDVSTVSVTKDVAKEAIANYQSLIKERRTEEDQAILNAYKEVLKGRQLVNISEAMAGSGVREDGYPNLAICRADEQRCGLTMRNDGGATFVGLKAEDNNRWWHNQSRRRVRVASGTFPVREGRWLSDVETMVPITPPHLRPKLHLRNFHILWEVEEWKQVPPRDPMLLKRLGGDLFAVLAVWDLTDVERAVLAGGR